MHSLPKFVFLVGYLSLACHLVRAEDQAPAETKETIKVEAPPGWIEIEAQISSLEAKFQAKTRAIEGLIEEKNHLKPNDPQLARVVSEIGKEDRERRKIAVDLEKQRTILHFRFPERGAAKNRKYEKVDIKSVNEIESSMGVDGRLNRSIQRMRSQYGSEESKKPKTSSPVPKKSTDQEGTIILQK
jgi:hypothetical protein